MKLVHLEAAHIRLATWKCQRAVAGVLPLRPAAGIAAAIRANQGAFAVLLALKEFALIAPTVQLLSAFAADFTLCEASLIEAIAAKAQASLSMLLSI